ncbi:MAG: hypothetical protein ACOCRA_05350 [Halobacteria archaeon]
MVNVPTVVAALVSVYLTAVTVAVLYLTYASVKQDISLASGKAA